MRLGGRLGAECPCIVSDLLVRLRSLLFSDITAEVMSLPKRLQLTMLW
jgi:hypothetical protein